MTAGTAPMPRWRLRVCYTKIGRLRFISHLDFVRLFERTARRAGLPLSYSEGFNPAPRIAYGWPLPVGMSGLGEYVDVELSSRMAPEEAAVHLNRVLPEGIEVRDARYISPHGPSLMAEFDTGSYVVHLPADGRDLEEWRAAATGLLNRSELKLTRERGGPGGVGRGAGRSGGRGPGAAPPVKVLDVRPLIRRLEVREVAADGRVVVFMELGLTDRGAGRPDEVASFLVAEMAGNPGNQVAPGAPGAPAAPTRPEGLVAVRLGMRRQGAART